MNLCSGGKWTTYRSMAVDAVDAAVETCGLEPRNGSLTDGLLLEGAHGWTPTSFIRLIQDFGLENEVSSFRCLSVNGVFKQVEEKFPYHLV